MGANYSRRRELRQQFKEVKAQLEQHPVATLADYKSYILALDSLQRAKAEWCWRNGIIRNVHCDGSGAAYKDDSNDVRKIRLIPIRGTHCALQWDVIVGQFDNEIVILYPPGTGGCDYYNLEDPRQRARDFCDACAAYHHLNTSRILIGPAVRIAYDI
jgi:hypothetical protein